MCNVLSAQVNARPQMLFFLKSNFFMKEDN